jgi:hypothetical protein
VAWTPSPSSTRELIGYQPDGAFTGYAVVTKQGTLSTRGEHASILEPGSDSLYDLVAFLSSLEVAFTVIEPPELRDLLHTLAARYQAAAREPGA